MAAAPEPLLCCLSAPGALVDFSWLAAPAEASIARVPGIERLSGSDLAALFRVANELEVSPDALAAIMSQESGFQPGIRNKKTGATGLIQFMPRTAEVMGTSTSALASMTFQQQLPYVLKFYKANGCKGVSAGGLYMCTFCPKLKDAGADVIIAHIDESAPGPCHPTASQSMVYAQNKILDVNKDGVITTGDVQESVMRRIRAASGRVRFDPNTPPEAPPSKGLAPLTLVVIGGAAYAGAKLLGWA